MKKKFGDILKVGFFLGGGAKKDAEGGDPPSPTLDSPVDLVLPEK